jgi:hypothetical protein
MASDVRHGRVLELDWPQRRIGPAPHGQLCLVEIADGRLLLRRPVPGSTNGTLHPYAQFGDPIIDAAWLRAALVKGIKIL